MNEPHDDLERWLRPSIEPMDIPEGAFRSVRRRAWRRRWAQAASAAATVAVVAFGGISGGLMLTGDGDGGIVVPPPPAAKSPAHSPSPASPTGSPSPDTSASPDSSPSASASAPEDTPAGSPTDESEQEQPPAPGQQDGDRAPDAETPTPAETDTGQPTSDDEVSACVRAQLSAESQMEGAGAGNVYWTFVFTNKSATSCSVSGYPDLVLLDGDKNRLPTQLYAIAPEPSHLVLEPGESAAIKVQAPNVRDPEDDCQPPSEYARFTPGDGQLTVPFESRACHGRTGRSGVHQ